MQRIKRNLVLLVSSLLLLLIWQAGSMLLDSQILLPGIPPVVHALRTLIAQPPFAHNILATALRALQSFLIIVFSATVVGVLAGRYDYVSIALRPFVTTVKAIPVMSIILLAFIWFSSGTVPLFSAFLMGFPVMYVQIEMGVRQLDHNLEEMCSLYDFRFSDKLVHFVIPSMTSWFIAGSRTALSMVWKVVIAAEVLTVPQYGVGARMQLAQVQLQTDLVLSWTLIAILLTAVGDLLFDALVLFCARLKRLLDARGVPCSSSR